MLVCAFFLSIEMMKYIAECGFPKGKSLWTRGRLQHVLPLPAIILFLVFFSALPASSFDSPFNKAANWGGTGLMEIPNARILEDGVIRFGFGQALPYRWFTGAMGVFPGREAGGRVTQITNIPSCLGSDYGSNKDKAFDLK